MYNALSSKVSFDNLNASTARLENQLSSTLSVHPVAADAVTATCNAAAWNVTGAYAEVVPASTITSEFFLDSLVIESVSAADTFLFQVAIGLGGAEVIIAHGRACFGHATNCGTVYIPIRKKIAANARIAVRATCKTAVGLTADVSISYRVIS